MVFSDSYKVALLSADRFCEEGALWLADELEKVCELKDELYLITAAIWEKRKPLAGDGSYFVNNVLFRLFLVSSSFF